VTSSDWETSGKTKTGVYATRKSSSDFYLSLKRVSWQLYVANKSECSYTFTAHVYQRLCQYNSYYSMELESTIRLCQLAANFMIVNRYWSVWSRD